MKLGQFTLLQTAAPEEGPNVAPLIDIVFILLIFFVVTTTFAKDLGLDIHRPHASEGTQQPTHAIRVAVGRRGELTVDGRPTSPWRLEAEVRDRVSGRGDKSVLLVADAGADAQTLVQIMDSCRKAGADQVAIAVDKAP